MKLLSKKLFLIVFFSAAFLIQSCGDDNNRFSINFDDAPPPFDTSQAASDTTIAGSVQVYIFEEGDGPFKVVSKDQIRVEITARDENGRVVDSSFNNRNAVNIRSLSNLTPTPSTVIVSGFQRVDLLVEGLRKALLGMKEGGVRTIVVPPELGFNDEFVSATGRAGPLLVPSFDLREQTITYDIELISIL